MPVWSWIVNILLWVLAAWLAWEAFRHIYKGMRMLKESRLSDLAEGYEELASKARQRIGEMEELKEEYEKILSEDEKRNEPKELAKTKKVLSELVNMIKLQYEAEERLSKQADQVIKNGGKLGVSTIIQIDATRNIAFAAALFASSGILLGISSAILAFTK